VEENIDFGNLAGAVLSIWLLTLLFATLSLALTGVGLRRGAAAGIGAGVAALTFLIDTLGPLADLPEGLRRVSPWYYYDGGSALSEGLSLGNSALLAGLVIAFLAVALVGFQRRDLAV
jgi:ABC-2 type transport system permease protein